jgi:antitoxin ParD1/3/4
MLTMTISVSEEMKNFVSGVIEDGTYSNVSEIFRDGLRKVQERQLRIQVLRKHINDAIAEEGRYSDEEVEAFLAGQTSKEV